VTEWLQFTLDGVAVVNVLALGGATFLVSLLVSAIGPTGGMQLAAVTATMPAQAVIPLHAWTTGFSALFRAVALRRHIDWRYLRWFVPASAVGSAVLTIVYARREVPDLQVVVASYILLSAVADIAQLRFHPRFQGPRPAVEGFITGIASMLIGATGPLLMTFMKPHQPDRERLVGTFSAGLTFQHLSKLVLFSSIGVQVFDYPWVLAAITVAAALGTWAGRHILVRLGERTYRIALSSTLIVASVWLIADGVSQ